MRHRNPLSLIVVELPILLLLVQGPGFGAGEDKLSIAGYVGKSSTAAAPGQNVVLYQKGKEAAVDSVTTNFLGRYKFSNLPPGEYVIKVGNVTREAVLAKKNLRIDIDLSAEGGVMDYAKPAAAAAPPQAGPGAAGPSDPALLQAMAGQWYSYSGSTERKVTLCPSGVYMSASESSYSGTMRDGGGNQTGAWGAGSQNRGQGSWSVQGNQQQGVITLVEKDGSKSEVRYQATGEKGCYRFNGTTFCYAGAPSCP
jgi:hypothetical protein